MSHDALFQLGMGSVSLNAAQTEEKFARYALRACAEAVQSGNRTLCKAVAALRAAALRYAHGKRWNNSAKVLIPLVVGTPPRP
jgi:hypothetical protein